jgi:hypothetical protein
MLVAIAMPRTLRPKCSSRQTSRRRRMVSGSAPGVFRSLGEGCVALADMGSR